MSKIEKYRKRIDLNYIVEAIIQNVNELNILSKVLRLSDQIKTKTV